MTDSISKALMLDKFPLNGKAVVIVQHHEGSAFLHSLLSQCAKQGRKICLVSFNQCLAYYHSVGSRLGWNLKATHNKHELMFFGGMEALKEVVKHKDPGCTFGFVQQPKSSHPLQKLVGEIENAVTSWDGQQFTIFIDEIDCLLSLGVKLKDVIMFYQHCHSLSRSSSMGSLVVSSGLSADGDVEAKQCAALVSHWSDLKLTEKGLQTGRSKDLSGTLNVRWNIPPFSVQQYQFKRFDRGIKMFAPGTSSAVL